MELVRCPNCMAVYGDVQDECPHCRADRDGEGPDVEFDGTTRTAIQALGGVFGGILEAPEGRHLVWCERGVILFDDQAGLMWNSRVRGGVDGVTVRSDHAVVTTGHYRIPIGLEDGLPLED